MAVRTRDLSLHHAKHGANGLNGGTSTMTGRTSLRLSTALTTSAVASATGDVLANLKLLGDACGNLLQVEFHLHSQVATLVLLAYGTSAKATETTAVTTEDVAEHREDVVHVHASSTAESAKSTLWTIKSELVILLAFLCIVQNLVSFCCLLKFFLGLLVARIAVWMILDSYLSISLLYFVFRC